MPSGLTSRALAVAVAAGAAGVGLAVAGVDSPVRAALVLVFLAVAPTTAIAGLLRWLDPFARVIIAGTTTVVILALTAIVMLAEGAWSPTGGLLAVTVITAGCFLAQLPPVKRKITAVAARTRKFAERPAVRPARTDAQTWPGRSEAGEGTASRPESSAPVTPASRAAADGAASLDHGRRRP
jgi:hypothetical protein